LIKLKAQMTYENMKNDQKLTSRGRERERERERGRKREK